jgi:hypothetical protein
MTPLSYVSAYGINKSMATHPIVGRTSPVTMASAGDEAGDGDITMLGFGSLLSEKSSRTTFPTLKNFRLGKVLDHRRVFCHPASIFFQRNIAKLETLEMSSLSVEYEAGYSMVCSVFEVPNEGLSASGPGDNFAPSQKFLEREEEFEITKVRYEELEANGSSKQEIKEGVICRRSTDDAYIARWGQERFQKNYLDYGIKTIWGWNEGIRPCVSFVFNDSFQVCFINLHAFSLFILGTAFSLLGIVIPKGVGRKMELVEFAITVSSIKHSSLTELLLSEST